MKNLLEKINSNNSIINLVEKIYQGNDLLMCSDSIKPLNLFLFDRLQLYIQEKDYMNEKIKIINENKINEDLLSQINHLSTSINKDNILIFISQLANKGIDLWFDYTDITPLIENKNEEIQTLNLNLI